METTTALDVYKLPNIVNISDVSPFTGFQETNDHNKFKSVWDDAQKRHTLVKRVVLIITIIFFVIVFIENYKGLFSATLNAAIPSAILYGLLSIVSYFFGQRVEKAEKNYNEKFWNFSLQVAGSFADATGARYFSFYSGEVFLYNDEFCAMIWAKNGSMVIYRADQIKKVTLEHVNLGSTTTSTSRTSGRIISYSNSYAGVSGTTTTTAHTSVHYEWRLDIYGKVIDHPKISLTFPEADEHYAKEIEAILTPD